MDAVRVKEFISRFSTKKDAIACVNAVLDTELVVDWRELKTAIEDYEDRTMAAQVIDMFNQIAGTRYENAAKIESVIRQMPKVTLNEFESVIRHKHETWGNDPNMKQYLRPATLFGSKNKFQTYLEDATHYWIEKLKNERRGA